MEALGVAANVVAVVDISIKVVTICSQYYKAVSSARDDIQRLENQVRGLQITLSRAREIIESPDNDSLCSSRAFSTQLDGCWATLGELLSKLEPNKSQSTMRKYGLRALKWPFSRKEMECTMSVLEQYQRRMMDSLQVDQTNMLLKIQNRVQEISIQPEINVPAGHKPQFVVPFPRDPDFVSRPDIQSWIREQYSGALSRIAIIGIGGMGKSQLAIDFAHEIHEVYPERSIFWVYGMTKDTLEESYRSVAGRLAIPGHDDPKTNVLALVRDWLQREDIAPWLLILDNADNMNTFFQQHVQFPTASYLPKATNGRILITSRSMTVAERLTGSFKAIKQISKMQNNEGRLLLESKLSQCGFDETVAGNLLRNLDFIPLAITQAAAYINRRKISLQKYLERFDASEKQKTSLLSHDAGDIWRHETVSNSIVVTWQVTFEQILIEKQSAADLLSLMSCFQPQGIPHMMLRGYNDDLSDGDDGDDGDDGGDDENNHQDKDNSNKGQEVEDDETLIASVIAGDDDYSNDGIDDGLEEDLDVLFGYSLLQKSEGEEELYEMHPLVQLCTRVWLTKANKLSHWDSLFLKTSSHLFPSGSYETWHICYILLPHIIPIMEKRPHSRRDLLNWAKLLYNAAWYTGEMGDFDEAEILIQRVVETRKNLLGAEHRDTLRSMAILGILYNEKGLYSEAEKLQLEVVAANEKTTDDDDPFKVVDISNLALTYYELSRWDEAEKLQIQVLETCKANFGEDDSMTLTAMSNLALTYHRQERISDAERLERHILRVRTDELGDEHPATLSIMNNLASTLMTKDQWAEAEKLQAHVLETRLSLVGDTHPDTLVNMDNMAAIYSHQGRLEEAEKLQRHIMEARIELLGPDHPDTMHSMVQLASTLLDLEKIEEADDLQLQTLQLRRAKLGDDNPRTLHSMVLVALALSRKDRIEEARKLMQECHTRRQLLLGIDHEDTEFCKTMLEKWVD